MQTSWILPLKISRMECTLAGNEIDELARYRVETYGGNPVGSRLLKGTFPPRIEDWGPFFDREEAVKLMERLEKHVKEYERKHEKAHRRKRK